MKNMCPATVNQVLLGLENGENTNIGLWMVDRRTARSTSDCWVAIPAMCRKNAKLSLM